MLIARTKKQARQIADAMMQEQIALEKPFTKKLIKLFNTISRDFEFNYRKDGSIINVEEDYQEAMFNLLLEQYQKTYKRFIKIFAGEKGRVIKLNWKEEQVFENEEDEDEFEALLLLYFIPLAERQTKTINATTQKSIKRNISKATDELLEVGEEVTKSKISKAVSSKISKEGIYRSPVISQTETGHAWSYTNEQAGKELLKKNDVQKIWVAELDDKTRPAHAEADGQIQDFGSFYIVGGEVLMFPRDYANGSAGNTINCRCESVPYSG